MDSCFTYCADDLSSTKSAVPPKAENRNFVRTFDCAYKESNRFPFIDARMGRIPFNFAIGSIERDPTGGAEF